MYFELHICNCYSEKKVNRDESRTGHSTWTDCIAYVRDESVFVVQACRKEVGVFRLLYIFLLYSGGCSRAGKYACHYYAHSLTVDYCVSDTEIYILYI